MTVPKRLGIWMDHSTGHATAYTAETLTTQVINAHPTHQDTEHGLHNNELHTHNREKQQQAHYFQALASVIRHYDEVVLFGPTEAKSELLNLLRKDHNFEKIKISLVPAEKMNEHQQQSFVRKYFSNRTGL